MTPAGKTARRLTGPPQPFPSTTVTSARLNSEAAVRNRLFPKTRSWFALEAPLELLSPLSVLRIVSGLSMVVWAVSAALLGGPKVKVLATTVVIASAALVWLALAFVRRTSIRWTQVILLVFTIQTLLLAWAGQGALMSYADLYLLMLISVAAGLFLSVRMSLIQQGTVLAGASLALAPVHGLAAGIVIGAMTMLASLIVSLSVHFLTWTAKRQGALDPDTGLPNGIGLSHRIGSRGADPTFVIAVVRLEGVNDARKALGYEVGTELLRRAVEDLGQVLPPDTFIGRVDGDELVVTSGLNSSPRLPVTRLTLAAEAVELAKTLTGAIEAGRYLVGDVEVSLRSHVGLALAPWDGPEIPELVRRASQCASRAVGIGRMHLLWDGDFGVMTADDLSLLADLRLAPERSELFLAYQPQIATATSRITSVEALVRWSSPTHGPVTPGRFIPLAERTGLIDRLTVWILDEALDAQARWREKGIDLPVSVNLSPKTLTSPDLSERIMAALDRRGLDPRCLTIEMTETAALDLLQAVSLLQPLHERGVRISIDDFGTGYTSLAVLPDLPLDELKVDQRFVRRVQTSPADDAIVRTVLELAHRLGLAAVAEGVETAWLFERMRQYGFDLLQGFHFSEALTEPQLLKHVASSKLRDGQRSRPASKLSTS
jgi:diguanylate cyclase